MQSFAAIKERKLLITRDGKEQDFDCCRSYVVVVVVVVNLRAIVNRAGRRLAAASVARQCPRTRCSLLLAHLLDDRLQLRDGRQAAWRHVRWRFEAEFAQNVVAYGIVAIVTFRLHNLHLAVYTTKLFGGYYWTVQTYVPVRVRSTLIQCTTLIQAHWRNQQQIEHANPEFQRLVFQILQIRLFGRRLKDR